MVISRKALMLLLLGISLLALSAQGAYALNEISLVSPDNGATITTNSTTFSFYSYLNASQPYRCDLIIDEQIRQTNYSVYDLVTTNFTEYIGYGTHTWSINCTYNSTTYSSETRSFTVTACYCDSCSSCASALGSSCTNVRLMKNITASGDCITSVPTGKTFDCKQNSIIGNNAGYGIKISVTDDRTFAIKNCLISNFSYGLWTGYVQTNMTNCFFTNSLNYDVYLSKDVSDVVNISNSSILKLFFRNLANVTLYNVSWNNISIYNKPDFSITNTTLSTYMRKIQFLDEDNGSAINSNAAYNIQTTGIVYPYCPIIPWTYTLSGSNNGNNTLYLYCYDYCPPTTSNAAFILDNSQIQYSATNYVTRTDYWFATNFSINQRDTRNDYLLLSSESQAYQVQVKDYSLNPLKSYFVSILRWYPADNAYKVVEWGQTDDYGNVYFHVRVNDYDYKIAVYDRNGTLLYMTSSMRMVCTTACYYELRVPSPLDIKDWQEIYNIQTNVTYNDSTKIFTFAWNDPSGNTKNMTLEIEKVYGDGELQVCKVTGAGQTGYIYCNLSDAGQGKFKVIVYRTASPDQPIYTTILETIAELFRTNNPAFGLLLIAIIMIGLVLLAAFSPVASLIFAIPALMIGIILGLISMSLFIGAFIVIMVAILLLKKVS